MAVTASFVPATGVLSEFGDTLDNVITTSRNTAGTILVNGGAVAVQGGTPTVANTTLIQAFGQGGNDTITLDEASGALPAANLFGEDGNDTLTGGSGSDLLDGGAGNDVLGGGAGNDTILGGNGADLLIGGDGNDFIDGQQGDDTALLGAGDDVFQWNPGGGSDIVEGQDGTDTLLFNGANINEKFDVSANGGRVLFTRDVANIVMDLNDVETVTVNALGGIDSVTVNDLTGTDVTQVAIHLSGTPSGTTGDGQPDTVTVNGTNGNDIVGILGAGTSIAVAGLHALVGIDQLEAVNDALIVDGGGGDDTISAQTVPAGIAKLTLDGGAGNDTLVGSQGGDVLRGGDGNDTLTGGPGDDQMFGEAGDDRMISNPGDGTDLMEGGDGTDTAEVNGGDGAETFTLTANGTRVRFDRLDPAPFSIDIGTTEKLVLNMNGGDDKFSATGNLAALIGVTVDGGAGNDTILGSNGADLLIGGDGNDFIDGQQGNDTALLGAGDDVFQWDPGDGSDIVEGQDGTDTLLFNGANINEKIDISANGGRVRFTRDIANITMDLDDVENTTFHALGGADIINVNDLTGTDVTDVVIRLASTLGGNTGDNQVDQTIVNGSNGDDVVGILGQNGFLAVAGLAALVSISTSEATDALIVKGGAGNDNLSALTLPAGNTVLTLDGGIGNDTLVGSLGADVLLGGDGNDTLAGGPGDDQMFGEAGDDRMISNPGDGTDLMEGGDGTDTAEVNGGNGAETFTLTANGTRVRFDQLDPVPFSIDIGTTEKLVLNMNGGDDKFSATGNLAALIGVTVDGGAGNDTILGSNGADLLIGGDGNDFIDGQQGNDIALLGAGDDVFQWDPGDGSDIVEGQDGTDTLLFNGANINEKFDVSANGGRVRFTRDVANIVMDLNDVETVTVNALGGADSVTVNDLTGTDVTDVVIRLAGTFGGNTGDNQVDQTIVNGSAGDDVVGILGQNGFLAVAGLAALVSISTSEATDALIVKGGLGNDNLSALTLPAGNTTLTLDGGIGNDTLVGSLGADVLLGGDGNDTLTGGPGNDALFGGAGNDVYFVDGAGDGVVENANEGNDTVFSTDHLRLSDNVENLVLQGGADLQGYGNSLSNVLTGNAGNNLLDGDAGADVMLGGAGNDVYFVDNAGDVVIENANEGNDAVFSTAHFQLSENVETLVLQGTADLQGYGNSQANMLFGNTGSNLLDGRAGADVMLGGAGNDVYFVDNAGDVVIENANEGNDAVFSTAHFQLSENVETLVLQGNADLQGYGNSQANTLFGNTGSNLLDGRVGADTMFGGAGNDVYFVDNAGDVVVENLGEGNDAVFALVDYTLAANVETLVLQGNANLNGTGNALANSIFGNSGGNVLDGGAGADVLDGGAGADVLTGGTGNDTFVFRAGQASNDTVVDFIGNGAAAGDALQFAGFGTAAQGATFTQIGASNQWQIHSGLDGHNEVVTFSNAAVIHPSDFLFL